MEMFIDEKKLDFSKFDNVHRYAYDWQIDDTGQLWGLVVGDQGYESAGVTLSELVGNALSASEGHGRSDARDWSGYNNLQDALKALLDTARAICGPVTELVEATAEDDGV
jgi:hypothetical protein